MKQLVLNSLNLTEGIFSFPTYYIPYIFLSTIFIFLTALFVSAGLIGASIRKSSFSFTDLINNSLSSFWKYLAFFVVVCIFSLGLLILLIIPGIIFMVYWIFGVYVMYDKKLGIRASLKESRRIVRGRWWFVFGYLLFVGLITILISFLAGLIVLPTTFIFQFAILSGNAIPQALFVADLFLKIIATFTSNLIILPLFTLFLKNFYFEMKGKKG